MAHGNGSDETFGSLHEVTAELLLEELRAFRNGERFGVDKEGNKFVLSPPPALVAQAIKLLKDNGIDQPKRKGNAIDRLKGVIPNMDEFEASLNVVPLRK